MYSPPSPYEPSRSSFHGLRSPYSTYVAPRLNPNGADLDRPNVPRSGQDCDNDPTPTQRSDDLAAARILRLHEAFLKSTSPAAGKKQEAQNSPREQALRGHASSQSNIIRPAEVGCRRIPTLQLATIPPASFVSAASSSRIAVPVSDYGGTSAGHIPSDTDVSRTFCDAPNIPASIRTQNSNMPLSGDGSSCTELLNSSVQQPELRNQRGSKVECAFACECCPKEPKRFATPEALSAHKAERLYKCSFCGDQFKNRNEVLRHQGSLHARPRSWTCSAISEYKHTFHDSKTRPGEADVCGYCGKEFLRSGCSPESMTHTVDKVLRFATEQDWEERFQHVDSLHNFKQCNWAKKFYRADHFRQHLKHSHAGTSWDGASILEAACMVEAKPREDIPERGFARCLGDARDTWSLVGGP